MSNFRFLLVYAVLATPFCRADHAAESTTSVDSAKLAAIQLVDVSGKRYSPFANDRTKAVALIFVSTDCPIANSFQPTLQELYSEFESQGIAFFLVYSSPKLSTDQIESHVKDFEIKMPTILDSQQTVGRLVNAKVTPEAIIVDADGEIRYRGLINNLYAGYGRKRQSATKHYIRDALNSLTNGTSVAIKETKPLGCFIRYEQPKEQRKKEQ